MEALLISVDEAAAVLNVKRSLMYEILRRPDSGIESLHLGRRRVIVAESIRRFIENQREQQAVPV